MVRAQHCSILNTAPLFQICTCILETYSAAICYLLTSRSICSHCLFAFRHPLSKPMTTLLLATSRHPSIPTALSPKTLSPRGRSTLCQLPCVLCTSSSLCKLISDNSTATAATTHSLSRFTRTLLFLFLLRCLVSLLSFLQRRSSAGAEGTERDLCAFSADCATPSRIRDAVSESVCSNASGSMPLSVGS